MMERFRAFFGAVFTPVARLLLRLGLSADAVTVLGTLGVCAGALVFFPRGDFLIGVLVCSFFVLADLVDGLMARLSVGPSKWGAFLDSTLDRFGDAAIFGGLAMYYAGPGESQPLTALALYCLVLGSITSYARARAEGLGMRANVGIAERSDRLVAVLAMTGLAGIFDAPVLITVVLAVLAVASSVTVLQRILVVRRQALSDGP